MNCAPNLPNHHEKQGNHEKQAINENHDKEEAISYLRFPIGKWKANSGEDDVLLQTFLATFLQLNIFKTKNLPSIVSAVEKLESLQSSRKPIFTVCWVSPISGGRCFDPLHGGRTQVFLFLWFIFYFGVCQYF